MCINKSSEDLRVPFVSTIFIPDCLKLLLMSNIQHLFNLLSVLKALGDGLTTGKK